MKATKRARLEAAGWAVGSADELLGAAPTRRAAMGTVPTATLSSKGQVVIPEDIRVQLGLQPGAQFVVIADRDVVIFKLLEPPLLRDVAVLVGRARRAAKETGLTRKDIAHAVRKVRRAR